MVLDSLKILACNKLVFTSIMLLTTLPLSTLIISQSISTYNLTSQILRLEAVAHLAHTRLEARHVWLESRHDAGSLLHIKALFSIPCYLLSLAAAFSVVHSTLLASHSKTPTFHFAVAALRLNWMVSWIGDVLKSGTSLSSQSQHLKVMYWVHNYVLEYIARI